MISNILIGVIGPLQIILIVAVILLIFGGKKIPELMKGIGQGIREFKDGMSGDTEKKKENQSDEKKGE
jgi:sec-independent protein translocase protein TatA